MEKLFSTLLSRFKKPTTQNPQPTTDFVSGIPVGASLGLLWTPCVGPILASVITLAATSQVNGGAVLITLAYALGTAIPMLAITFGGRQLLARIPGLFQNIGKIQKIFGVIMILTATAMLFNVDRKIQTVILTTFPSYGTGLTFLEDNSIVKSALQQLNTSPDQKDIGKPMNEITNPYSNSPSRLPNLGKAPGFTNLSGSWINSDPLTIEELKGKVILVDFWTYTCINCIRTLPYIQRWHETYKDQGLVIVGVHTPEFEFEKSLPNVQQAVKDFKLTYPIVQDNYYGIWQDYANRYWPAKYLIDKDGNIRYTHFGEGAYDETEQHIQELLEEAGSTVDTTINNPTYQNAASTPELYLGYGRIRHLVSPEKVSNGTNQLFTSPAKIPLNYFAYEGNWMLSEEYAQPQQGAKLSIHFGAKEVFLVMRPKNEGLNGNVMLRLNNSIIPLSVQGDDVTDGKVTVTDNRLYKLIQRETPEQGILELEFLDNNIEVYAFTFG